MKLDKKKKRIIKKVNVNVIVCSCNASYNDSKVHKVNTITLMTLTMRIIIYQQYISIFNWSYGIIDCLIKYFLFLENQIKMYL